MTNWKFIISFSGTLALICCIATWLVIGESSPFQGYFFDHVALPNLVRKLTVIPYLALITIRPETEFGEVLVATAVEFIQWLTIGFLLALFINFVRSGRQTKRTKWLE